MHDTQLRLQEEAQGLAQRLEVILHDKFQKRHVGFDSDTPIDKTLNFLQSILAVSETHTSISMITLSALMIASLTVTHTHSTPMTMFRRSWGVDHINRVSTKA